MITKKLSENDPVFMDGLMPIYKTKNKLGQEIVLYKRYRYPTASNFAKIVEYLAENDKNNLWNVPFLYVALDINPNLTELKKQLKTMSNKNFLDSVSYNYGDIRKKYITQQILQKYKQIPASKLGVIYPDCLSKI